MDSQYGAGYRQSGSPTGKQSLLSSQKEHEPSDIHGTHPGLSEQGTDSPPKISI
jgi:hypothetical protein